jgi:hypothetical protein
MPKKTNGYTQVKAHAKQDRKRREAYARQDKYDALPLAEKIAGMGAKHKARYEKQQAALAKRKPAPTPVATATVEVKPKKAYQKPKKS